METLRGISSRAEIAATDFDVVYNFGNLKGDPGWMMEHFFDVMIYVANRGRGY